jgi:hypothetical protein
MGGKENGFGSWAELLAKNGARQRYFSGDSEFSTASVGAEPGEYQASQRIAPTKGWGFIAVAAKLPRLKIGVIGGTKPAASETTIVRRVNMRERLPSVVIPAVERPVSSFNYNTAQWYPLTDLLIFLEKTLQQTRIGFTHELEHCFDLLRSYRNPANQVASPELGAGVRVFEQAWSATGWEWKLRH